jgi:hypothetical protein
VNSDCILRRQPTLEAICTNCGKRTKKRRQCQAHLEAERTRKTPVRKNSACH